MYNSRNKDTKKEEEKPLFISGLTSITFRQLSPQKITLLTKEAHLNGIEWGSDLHVPPGNSANAESVRKITEEAGLSVISYGSYYRAGISPPSEFETILSTAAELGAPTIRIWAGNIGSDKCSENSRQIIVQDLKRISRMATEVGLSIACEYHGETLTDSTDSALNLMKRIGPSGAACYWQPLPGIPPDEHKKGLREILPWLANLHVYHWHPETRERLSLKEGMNEWRQWLKIAADSEKKESTACLIEFVRDNSPENFLSDARTLNKLLAELN